MAMRNDPNGGFLPHNPPFHNSPLLPDPSPSNFYRFPQFPSYTPNHQVPPINFSSGINSSNLIHLNEAHSLSVSAPIFKRLGSVEGIDSGHPTTAKRVRPPSPSPPRQSKRDEKQRSHSPSKRHSPRRRSHSPQKERSPTRREQSPSTKSSQQKRLKKDDNTSSAKKSQTREETKSKPSDGEKKILQEINSNNSNNNKWTKSATKDVKSTKAATNGSSNNKKSSSRLPSRDPRVQKRQQQQEKENNKAAPKRPNPVNKSKNEADKKKQIGSGKSDKPPFSTPSTILPAPLPIPPECETLSLECTAQGCKADLSSERELVDHLKEKHKLNPFICFVQSCNFSTQSNLEFMKHLVELHGNEWSCHKCKGLHKMSAATLITHIYIFHEMGQFRCIHVNCAQNYTVCSEIFFTRKWLYEHREKAHCNNQHQRRN